MRGRICVFDFGMTRSEHLPAQSTQNAPCLSPPQGSYSLPQSDFYLPYMDLPYWLTNGDYRVQGVLGARGKELGCLKVALSLHSD